MATRHYNGKVFRADRMTIEVQNADLTVSLISITSDLETQECDIIFDSEPTTEDDAALDSIIASHSGEPLTQYRVWCSDCGDFVEDAFVEFPTACPICSGENIEDITNKNFAIQGKPVSEEMPSGFHTFTLDDRGGNKWILHRGYVQFPSKLDKIPSSINISNAIFDGTASLVVESITRRGFKFSVGSVGKAGNWGFTSVEFDWEAVE